MRDLWFQFRRAPGRIIASVFALALAVGAVGVLAIPTVSEHSLHEVVAADHLGDLVAPTSLLGEAQLDAIGRIDNVATAEGELVTTVSVTGVDDQVRLVGLRPGHTLDAVRIIDGRPAARPHEVVVSDSLAPLGANLTINGEQLAVVGHGTTLWWGDGDTVFTDLSTAQRLTGRSGTNHLVVRAEDDSADRLDLLVDQIRDVLEAEGDTLTELPDLLADGTTPIDSDIRQISTLIGLLGMVAGVVALVLLASTANTLIAERTRETAVMRALGGQRRPLRRRLRRIALAITGMGLVLGLPLGVFIANLIARMVLEKFVGITPEVAIDWYVVAGSVIGFVVGARLVAGRAARRVTRADLAEALRDRDGSPYGRSFAQRLLTRIPTGGLLGGIAVRSWMRRPGRTIAIVAQVAIAVGAAFLIPSLTRSVNAYNDATMEPWAWESHAVTDEPGLSIPFSGEADGDEVGVSLFGTHDDYDMDVIGVSPDSTMFTPALTSGRWFSAGSREAMVSRGFARRRGIDIGETIAVEIGAGDVEYSVVGLVDDAWLAVYVDRTTIATDAGFAGQGNVVWSTHPSGPATSIDSNVIVETRAEAEAANGAGRDAIAVIFGAIGAIVTGVAVLALVSSLTVSLYERRHEYAALQSLGARRRLLRRLLLGELLPLSAAGLAGGLVLGALGTKGIIAAFEASNSIDIGTVSATDTVPLIVAATVAVAGLVVAAVVRTAARRPIAVTLRGAA